MVEDGARLGLRLGEVLGRLKVGVVLGAALSPVGCSLVVGLEEPDGKTEGDAVKEGAPVGERLGN